MSKLDAYYECSDRGPFPGQIDPWAEIGHYFQQIHGGMIGYMLEQIRAPLRELGYRAGREASLIIAACRKPDIAVESRARTPEQRTGQGGYSAAAVAIEAEPGIMIAWEDDTQDAITIRERGTGRLVTVVELISPRNKTSSREIRTYQDYRTSLLQQEVSVVEIDLTRSFTRLLQLAIIDSSPYHVLIYMPDEVPRFIGIEYGQPLKRIALPVRQAVVPLELQSAYEHAYRVVSIAGRIEDDDYYTLEHLPYPTTLTPAQRQDALEKVAVWRTELERLRNEPA